MTGPYLTLAQAAEYVGRSDKWIRRRLDRIAHFRDGTLLFTRAGLDAYLSTKAVRPVKVKAEEPLAPPVASIVRGIFGPRVPRGGKKKASP